MAVATSTQSTAKTSRHEQMLIDGAWTDGSAREAITVLNPGNRKPIATVPRGGAEDVDRAVKAAQAAFPAGAASRRAIAAACCRRSPTRSKAASRSWPASSPRRPATR